jgi:hypothetical protein
MHSFELCFGGTGAFDCSAFEQLIDCCPAITKFSLQNVSMFKRDVSLAPLLRLQQLAQLECHSVVDGDVSVGVLARLGSLKRLHLRASPGLTEVGLLQLAALTGWPAAAAACWHSWLGQAMVGNYGAEAGKP